MAILTTEELEVKIGSFLDTLPLELTRGQAAMLFVRMAAFAEAVMPADPVKTDGRRRIMSAQERAKRSAAVKAQLAANPKRLEMLLAAAAKGRDAIQDRVRARKNGAGS